MKAATLHEIKSALQELSPSQMLAITLRLAKYRNDNKELISYLLFESDNEDAFIKRVKEEIDLEFEQMNRTNIYYAKKSIRKVLRTLNKYIRYSGSKQTAAEILIHFSKAIRQSGIDLKKSDALNNLYLAQRKKIEDALQTLHEDIQYDLRKEMEEL